LSEKLSVTMPKKRTPMTKIYDVLRLKFEAKLSNRDVAHCLKIGAATVSDYSGPQIWDRRLR